MAAKRTMIRDVVPIGQRWRLRRSELRFRITQIHRADKLVEMTVMVPFSELRKRFELLP